MSLTLMQLSVCLAALIQLRSSQPTVDYVIEKEDTDICTSEQTEHQIREILKVLNHLTMAVSQPRQNGDNSSCKRIEQLVNELVTQSSNRTAQVFIELTTVVSQSNSRTNQVLDQLMTQLERTVSQIQSAATDTQTRLSRLETSVSQQSNAVSQLQIGMGQLQTSVTDSNTRTEQMLSQLTNETQTRLSRLETSVSQILTGVTQLQTSNAQLWSDVMRAIDPRKGETEAVNQEATVDI